MSAPLYILSIRFYCSLGCVTPLNEDCMSRGTCISAIASVLDLQESLLSHDFGCARNVAIWSPSQSHSYQVPRIQIRVAGLEVGLINVRSNYPFSITNTLSALRSRPRTERKTVSRIKSSSKTVRSSSIFQGSKVRPNRRVDIEELDHNEWYIRLSEEIILKELFDRVPVFQVD